MEELLISPYWLAVIFLFVALVYSTVGLGGGTSYAALLAIFGAAPLAIPTISLILNVLVSLIVSIAFIRAGHARWKLIGALLLASAPMAYLGGWLEIAEELFYLVLIAVLLLVAARIFLWPRPSLEINWTDTIRLAAVILLGATIGFLSGLIGIGGGIFLIPALVILGLTDEKEAAAAGGVFVFINSLAGLTAHLQVFVPAPGDVLPLVAAVILGSLAGSYLGAIRLKRRTIQLVMGGIVLFAALVLIFQLL